MATAIATKATSKGKATKAATGAQDGAVGVKALADQVGTDGRSLRKWLRARGDSVGKGAKYEFTTAQAKRLATEWEQQQAE